MASDTVVSVLQLAHAGANAVLFIALAYQGSMGLRIRRRRTAGVLQDFSVVKRHRALGPVLASLLPVAYAAGVLTAYLHKGRWAPFPRHFAVGTALLAVVFLAVAASKNIRSVQSSWRSTHFALGLMALGTFLVQISLGLDILL
jgi:hypothetical protein